MRRAASSTRHGKVESVALAEAVLTLDGGETVSFDRLLHRHRGGARQAAGAGPRPARRPSTAGRSTDCASGLPRLAQKGDAEVVLLGAGFIGCIILESAYCQAGRQADRRRDARERMVLEDAERHRRRHARTLVRGQRQGRATRQDAGQASIEVGGRRGRRQGVLRVRLTKRPSPSKPGIVVVLGVGVKPQHRLPRRATESRLRTASLVDQHRLETNVGRHLCRR